MGCVERVELGAGIFEMELYRAFADVHDLADIPIRFARGTPAQALLLPLRQQGPVIGGFHPRIEQGVMVEMMRNQQ